MTDHERLIKQVYVSENVALELLPAKVAKPPMVLIHSRRGSIVAVPLQEIQPLANALIEASFALSARETEDDHDPGD